jgi:hypothetical protein
MEFVESDQLFRVLSLKDDVKSTGLTVLGEYFSFDLLVKLLEKLGWQEDVLESKKHLNYEILTLQSKRLFNRINHYLDSKKLDLVNDLLKGILKIQVVKTKSK